MSYVKAIIILVVLVPAMGQNVASKEDSAKVCKIMRNEILRKAVVGTPEEVLTLAKGYSIVKLKFFNEGRKMMRKAMKAILNQEECSDSSFEYLHLMGECRSIRILTMFDEPTKTYANKCLTIELVNQKVKSAVAGSTVDFLSPAFIKKFHEGDPPYRPTLEPQIRTHIAGLSVLEIIDSMERDFQKENQNLKDIFSEGVSTPALVSYLNEKLFNPCDNYVKSVGPFMIKLGHAVGLSDGKFKNLFPTLDKEVKEAIFRYMYCYDSQSERHKVVNSVAKILLL